MAGALDRISHLNPKLYMGVINDIPEATAITDDEFTSTGLHREILIEAGAYIYLGCNFPCQTPLSADGQLRLVGLLSLGEDVNYSIVEAKDGARDWLPVDYFPIGDCEGGNFVCIDPSGRITFWDHEGRDNPLPDEEPGWWPVANSFEEFIDSLIPAQSDGLA